MVFDRKTENSMRNMLQTHINSIIDKTLDDYYEKNKNDVGYLLIYPLIHLEDLGVQFNGAQAIEAFRKMISWFIQQMFIRGLRLETFGEFKFNLSNYYVFQKHFIGIMKCYADQQFSSKLKDMSSHGKIGLFSEDGKEIKFKSPEIINVYEGNQLYFHGDDKLPRFRREMIASTNIQQYLLTKSNWRKVERLSNTIDKKLLSYCETRVRIDFEKMGGKIKSEVVDKYEFYLDFISFLYYLAMANLHRYKIGKSAHVLNQGALIVNYSSEWLADTVELIMGVPKVHTLKYISYLTFNNKRKGTLAEYPFIVAGDFILFIPSNFLLNDWSFSITNGHYLNDPRIEFDNRKDTISSSIIYDIQMSLTQVKNILVSTEFYYEYNNDEGKQNSDIDLALYDLNTNHCVIIECKWLEKVFSPNEVYPKVYGEFNTIFKEQIKKHQEFLDISINNLSLVFGNHSEVVNNCCNATITYVLVDKRVEYHTEDKHMFSIYSLLSIFRKYTDGEILRLDKVVAEIGNLRTEIHYNNHFSNNDRKIRINEYEFLTPELFLDYKEML